jgi:hypothetical protein
MKVDPVEKGSRDLPAVSSDVPLGAATVVAGISAKTAGTRIHSSHEEKPGGKGARTRHPGNRDDSVLERLAQRLQRVPTELGKLVQEENTKVGQRELAWFRIGASPCESRGRGAMVRRAEGPSPEEAASGR